MKTYGIAKPKRNPKPFKKTTHPCIVCKRVEQYPSKPDTIYICSGCTMQIGTALRFKEIMNQVYGGVAE